MTRTRIAVLLLAGLVLAMNGRRAQAIPDPASLGIRVFDSSFQQVGGVPVLITLVDGQYLWDPLVIESRDVGVFWIAVPTGTYSIVALDDDLQPIGPSEVILFAPPGAHDILVNLLLPEECPADLDGDFVVGITDLLAVLAAWGTPGGDLDGDGTTGVTDLLVVLADWGSCDQS